MGHVEKRQQLGTVNVKWRVRYRDPSTGKEKSRTFDRKRDADAFNATNEASKLTGTYVDQAAGRETLREYAERWRESRAGTWSPNTQDRTASNLTKHVYPALGHLPIAAIRPTEVQAWVTKLSATLKPRSVAAVVGNLSGVFTAAKRDRVVNVSPVDGVDLPKIPHAEFVPLTVEQVEMLREGMPEHFRALVVVGAGLGLRVSEALGLTVDRVDFLRRTVRVDRQIVERKGEVTLTDVLKTRASYRTVPLPSVVGEVLSAHVKRFGVGAEGAIFHDESGRLFRRRRVAHNLHAVTKRVNEASDMPVFRTPERFHNLRHFYASALIESGASVKTVQRRLGQASAVVTLDTYGHLWPDAEEATREAIDALFLRPAASLGNLARG